MLYSADVTGVTEPQGTCSNKWVQSLSRPHYDHRVVPVTSKSNRTDGPDLNATQTGCPIFAASFAARWAFARKREPFFPHPSATVSRYSDPLVHEAILSKK